MTGKGQEMSGPRRQAFTLAELMVAIAVIALVAAILVPFFQKAFAIQRRVTCANNLEKIGQAYATRAVDGAVLTPIGWTQSLASYVSSNEQIFICPEDDELNSDPLQTLREVYIEVFTGAANDYNTHAWDVPLDEGEDSRWIWRLSEEQFQEFERAPGHGQSYRYNGYVPGKDPTRYWFVFEDQGWKPDGGDKDYWDLLINVQYMPETIDLVTRPIAVGYNFNLCMGRGENKVKLLEDVKNKPSTRISLPGGTGTGSYGMNTLVSRIASGKDRLLVLDYEKSIAKGSDYETGELDNWWGEGEYFQLKDNGIPTFARHFDKANVLSANGAVRLMDVRKIDPDKAESRRKYWNP